MSIQSEAALEAGLIATLRQMDYEYVQITEEDNLYANFKRQLEIHNKKQLAEVGRNSFTDEEFEKILIYLEGGTRFEKAKKLRDLYPLDTANGQRIWVEFLNRTQWCQNEFQVSSQITVEGRKKCRYDVTILINGLPLVQIELKRRGVELKQAYNQIQRYHKTSFHGLFDYIQLFVISNGVNTRYFANNPNGGYKFTFNWTDAANLPFNELDKFAVFFLEKCTLGKIIGKYIVLHEGDKCLMVLRPYQFYAVEKILDRVQNSNDNGYIWHTTGAGKTLTSFKTAQLVSELDDVDKVMFVVDRHDLDTQTQSEYEAFEPGAVDGTDNTDELVKRLHSNSKIIITTIQKLNAAVSKTWYSSKIDSIRHSRIVMIFDECHRSHFGESHKKIMQFFDNAQIFGFTGTPIFTENAVDGHTTKEVFGNCLHRYLIKDAIADENVLGFLVEYYHGSEVVLYANANLPNGSTLEQMNTLIKRMETYLSEFKEIKQFQTSVESARRASISIRFTKENQKSGFPYTLKANMISKALQLGGGDWSIYGLQDQGFSNSVRENAGSFRVKMYGYNYDELYSWATKLKEVLLSHRRIREVTVGSNFSWWKDDYQEFYFELDKQRMIGAGIGAGELFAAIRPIYGRNQEIGSVVTEDGTEKIKLSSRQSDQRDIWAMQYYPFRVGDKEYKLAELAKVEKGQMPQEVAKENQQYRLCLQYEYIGASEQGNKLLKKDLEEFNELLPMGYKAEAESNNWSWGGGANKQYRLLLIVIAIIFFITSILFNSLKQPLAIIFVIPISYIGVFLTFYWFKLNFDQGGFASFILLCGITVNASIYILNEYNAIRKRFPCLSPLRAYVKAWNTKVIPIFLTVVSTILGFIPFMVGAEKEGFWFPLAAGTIGGLVMSVIGVFIFLPVLTLNKKKMMVKKP